jgi:hypothetical protein
VRELSCPLSVSGYDVIFPVPVSPHSLFMDGSRARLPCSLYFLSHCPHCPPAADPCSPEGTKVPAENTGHLLSRQAQCSGPQPDPCPCRGEDRGTGWEGAGRTGDLHGVWRGSISGPGSRTCKGATVGVEEAASCAAVRVLTATGCWETAGNKDKVADWLVESKDTLEPREG